MDRNNKIYRMYTLMNYTDMDAFTAQKNAGSNGKYFHLLAEFVDTAPLLMNSLTPPANEDELAAYIAVIDTLQDKLLAIGSSALMWEAEKAAEVARSFDQARCASETHAFASRVNQLCGRIEEARIISPDTQHRQQVQNPAPAQISADRQKAPVKVESYERLCLLVENFETDAAIDMLNKLMLYSYTDEIDQGLNAAYNCLAAYDFGGANAAMKYVMKSVQSYESASGGQKKKILAIDDVPDVLHTVKSALKNNYTVYGVTNHMAALKFLMTNSADLILLDIEMPDMDGFALLEIIRKIKAYKTTPVMFLTGSVSIENIKRSVQVGGNDFIKKPIDIQILIAKIQKHIG